jgi:hypothetical protein
MDTETKEEEQKTERKSSRNKSTDNRFMTELMNRKKA